LDAPGSFSVTAIMASYNEEDIIGLSLQHLIEQGVSVYLIDRASTDATVAEAQRFAGKGLIAIERLPEDSAFPAEDAQRFSWARILERTQKLAQELDGDWFIHHGVDEFRESPWPHLDLCQAIRRVQAAGYNAIDFAAFGFPPTDDNYRKGDDLRATFRYCEPARRFDRLRINAWKKSSVDLLSSGGHEAIVAERRVFPVRFLLRHYPIRNQAQGERKILQEGEPRRDPAERALGSYAQYDGVESGARLIRDPATLTAYDPDAIRLQLFLRHRGVEELESALAVSEHDLDVAQREGTIRSEELEQLRREQVAASRGTEHAQQERDALARTLVEVEGQRDVVVRTLEAAKWERDELDRTLDEVEAERDTLARTLDAGERERDTLARARDEVRDQRDSLARTLDEVQGQRDSLTCTLSDVQAQRDSLVRTLQEVEGQRDSLTCTLSDVQAQRDSLTRTLEEVEGQRDSLARTLSEVQAQRDALAHSNDELGASLARRQARIDELLSSWSWRATGPAREVLRRLRGT
jgi:sugar-specific transcriptional regulator TrmB